MKLIHKIFWGWVADDIAEMYGHGHPRHWTTTETKKFLSNEFIPALSKISKSDEKKARRYLTLSKGGKFSDVTLHVDTVRRLIVEQTSGGQTATREMFAIYLGYDSVDHYRRVRGVYEEVKRLEKVAKEEKNRKRGVVLLLLFFGVIIFTIAYFDRQNAPTCDTEVVTSNQFILVRTDDGINFIDPNKKINKVLAEGPHFTGFGYDREEGFLFWSNTNHNYRTIGRANLSNGLVDKNRNHRFIKNLPYPVGIALDTTNNILYLADYGTFNQLNDGSIRAYDYEGNPLRMIYQDSIDPSSIILDMRSQMLYWTDPRKGRIGSFDLHENLGNPNFLIGLGRNPDGMALDQQLNRLYWASNKDSLIGWVNLDDHPLQPIVRKLHETATALVVNPKTGHLLYTSHDQEKIKWLEIKGDSIRQSDCGQTGIQTGAGSPGVVQLFIQQ